MLTPEFAMAGSTRALDESLSATVFAQDRLILITGLREQFFLPFGVMEPRKVAGDVEGFRMVDQIAQPVAWASLQVLPKFSPCLDRSLLIEIVEVNKASFDKQPELLLDLSSDIEPVGRVRFRERPHQTTFGLDVLSS
jgi:hypothetical protein